MGEEPRLCVDTNCHSKSITVPVTVVLGLAAAIRKRKSQLRNPRQLRFFCEMQTIQARVHALR